MKHLSVTAVAMAIVLGAPERSPSAPRPEAHDRLPAASWAPADSADALWRNARDAFSDGDYERASDLFQQIHSRYPRSVYAGDAYYWEASSLYYVAGSTARQLRRAVDLLEAQQQKYADSRTVRSGESRALSTRIRGLLAKNGDAASAADIATRAERATEASTPRSPSASASASASATPRGGRAAQARAQSGCRSEEDDERVEALNALLQMSSDQAVPLLKRVLARREPCSEVLRRKVPFLLSQKHSDEAVDLLLGAAQNDPDRETREQAVFWLSQASGQRAVTVLEQILRTSTDEGVQNNALFALSSKQDARAQQAVRDYASKEDAPQNVREQAIFWLGQRRNEDNAQFLKQLFGKTRSEDTQQKILFSLAQQRGFGNESWIIDQALNTKNSMEVRKQALFWAAQSGGVDVARLSALYDRAPEREFKEQVIFALSQKSRSTEALDKLIDIAKNEKDRELRKNAIFWLGQSKDPRAMKALQDLIEKLP